MNELYTILGIETSCDETGAAIYHPERGLISNALFSQQHHKFFGGVIPELASRSQLEKINIIIQEALDNALMTLDEVDAIAVTNKPGLAGSLLVGLCFTKALAWSQHKPLIGINHLEGHAFSPFLEYDVPFPHLCLSASGGHTALYRINNFGDFVVLGQTIDDAAGEAFDKVAKMMGFPYPGGPIIEQLAQEIGFADTCHYPRQREKILDFSFSGIKTAVLYDLVRKGAYNLQTKEFLCPEDRTIKQEVASSLLVCIGDIFNQKVTLALEQHSDVKAVTFVGGVACNKYLRTTLSSSCVKKGLAFFAPSPQFCTDNGAMIAFVGSYKAAQGRFSDLYLDIFE
jgi:tRNA N6-adenosine threonylcarbamoyltransferase